MAYWWRIFLGVGETLSFFDRPGASTTNC